MFSSFYRLVIKKKNLFQTLQPDREVGVTLMLPCSVTQYTPDTGAYSQRFVTEADASNNDTIGAAATTNQEK